jgi:3-oxoadipate CoA-transferase beta subunit
MDLAVGAREIRVIMEHTTKEGAPRLRRRCSYPLTAARVVRRIYTNLAVIDVARDGLVVREMVPGLDLAALQQVSEPRLTLANNWKVMDAPPV